ncbi:chromatin assembly factor 1 subunit A [Neosynchiropus ocellatus]
MLAAETTPVDGHLAASTPRRRGTNCKSKPNANKKLVQARLPFKRLNPEPKDNELPKRPSAHACVEPDVSDGENENGSSPSVFNGPPLVNGQGPLDCFFSHKKPASSNEKIIDLTEDSLSSPAKCFDAPVSRCTPTKDKTTFPENLGAKPPKSENDNCTEDEDNKDMDSKDQSTISILETTQESDGEQEELNESANIPSFGNHSMLSATSHSSLSDSSPEKTKTDEPATVPSKSETTADKSLEQKRVIRRSSKSFKEQQERLRLREEKERLKEEAKAAKEKKRQELRRLKEEKEKERREKKERDEREKREKKEKEEKEKAEKLKAKEEQRKSKLEAKAEEKRKKEEEKKMKEEEKRLKEEKDRLKAEKAEITRFLQKHKTPQSRKTLATACGKFAPFEIKDNMCMAPLCRVQCENSVLEELDQHLLKQSDKLGGVNGWISQKPRRSGPTRPKRPKVLGDCIQMDGPKAEGVPDRKHYGSMKLLQFHENYRPAYWGTWTKKSSVISARCPLKQDRVLLDYEVDSDEEWEEEEPGESLSHSEGEDEEEGGEDDEDDDGFFVPHGYLSDDEGALEEEDGGDLEKQKLQQKLRAREWDELMSTKKKMKVLEPVVRGCHWEGEDPGLEVFQSYAVVLVEPLPKADHSPSPDAQSKKSQREEQLLRQLLPLLHGNFNSCKVIISEFQEFCRQETPASSTSEMLSPQSPSENVPARKLKRLIKNNAVYEKRSAYRRSCWYVHAEVLAQWGLEALPVPCQWTYITTGAREESRDESQAATGSHGNSPTTPQTSSATASSSKRKSTGSMSITKFMKRCNDPEQRVATDTDGFQADTEDDEEECMIVDAHSGPSKEKQSMDDMEVAPSETAALPESSAAPSLV